MMRIFSCAFWLFVHLLWWKVPLNNLSLMHFLFFLFLSYENLKIYIFWIQLSQIQVLPNICKYFVPLYGLYFHFLHSVLWSMKLKNYFLPFFFFFNLFRAASAAHGGSQARGWIGAIAAGLRQSHSNVGSEPSLRPTPQLMAMLDP